MADVVVKPHGRLVEADGLHGVVWKTVDDEAALHALTVTAEELERFVRVRATGALMVLQSVSPAVVWNRIAFQGAASAGVVFQQATPSDTWIFDHGLGRYPALVVTDAAGNQLLARVTHDSVNRSTIRFGAPTSGSATAL